MGTTSGWQETSSLSTSNTEKEKEKNTNTRSNISTWDTLLVKHRDHHHHLVDDRHLRHHHLVDDQLIRLPDLPHPGQVEHGVGGEAGHEEEAEVGAWQGPEPKLHHRQTR